MRLAPTKKKAAALKAEYEAKLKEIDKEAETILADARQKGVKEPEPHCQ